MQSSINRPGITLVEVLVLIFVVIIVLGLLLPAIHITNHGSNRMRCSNNFKQLGLAMHNYHSAFKHLPMAMGGTGVGKSIRSSNFNRLSGLVAMTPFFEEQALWDVISNPSKFDGATYPSMGPAPWVKAYEPWSKQLPTLRCPDSQSSAATGFGSTGYTFCIGDTPFDIHQPSQQRGMFACGMTTRFHDCTDGLSNTIAMGEVKANDDRSIAGNFAIRQPSDFLNNPSLCLKLIDPAKPGFQIDNVAMNSEGRGSRWADGAAGFSLVNTILPPNSPSCAINGSDAVDGLYSASSYHQGGCHVLMGDGAVRFITESIECGDISQPSWRASEEAEPSTESPYGLWGALGSANGQETINQDF